MKQVRSAAEWQKQLKNHHFTPAIPAPVIEHHDATQAHMKLQSLLKYVFNGSFDQAVRGFGVGLDHESRREETVLKINFRSEAALSKAMRQLPPVVDNFRVKLYAEKAPANSL